MRTASLRHHPDGDALSRLRAIGAYAYTVSQGEYATPHNNTCQTMLATAALLCAVLWRFGIKFHSSTDSYTDSSCHALLTSKKFYAHFNLLTCMRPSLSMSSKLSFECLSECLSMSTTLIIYPFNCIFLFCLAVAIKNKARRLAREEQWTRDAADRESSAAGAKDDAGNNKGKIKDKGKDKNKNVRRKGGLVDLDEKQGGDKEDEGNGGKLKVKKEKKADRINRLAEEKRKRKEREKSEQGQDEGQALCTAHNMHKVSCQRPTQFSYEAQHPAPSQTNRLKHMSTHTHKHTCIYAYMMDHSLHAYILS